MSGGIAFPLHLCHNCHCLLILFIFMLALCSSGLHTRVLAAPMLAIVLAIQTCQLAFLYQNPSGRIYLPLAPNHAHAGTDQRHDASSGAILKAPTLPHITTLPQNNTPLVPSNISQFQISFVVRAGGQLDLGRLPSPKQICHRTKYNPPLGYGFILSSETPSLPCGHNHQQARMPLPSAPLPQKGI